jgi:hypothetical protein
MQQALTTYIPFNPYLGCVADTSSYGQPLLYGPTAQRDTQESCKKFCTTTSGGPYKYFGVKSGSDCHCGNSFLHPAAQHPGECTTACSSNTTQECGGPNNRMSIWQNSDWPLVRAILYTRAALPVNRLGNSATKPSFKFRHGDCFSLHDAPSACMLTTRRNTHRAQDRV